MNELIRRQDATEVCMKYTGHGFVWACIMDEINQLPSVDPEAREIGYAECASAMLKMWIDNVLTDGEYNKIMDKLNDFERRRREEGPHDH